MEALQTAINAMKKAEEALSKQGFTLKWKVRLKADSNHFCLPSGAAHGHTEWVEKAAILIQKTESASVPLDCFKGEEETLPQKIKPEEQPVTAYNSKEAADYLGLKVTGLYNLVSRGKIKPHGEIGKHWYTSEELDAYIKTRERRYGG